MFTIQLINPYRWAHYLIGVLPALRAVKKQTSREQRLLELSGLSDNTECPFHCVPEHRTFVE